MDFGRKSRLFHRRWMGCCGRIVVGQDWVSFDLVN